eukprot:Skav221077  [mRNA]  locus=scaffold3118:408562:418463:- [translate_table: standard]
MPRDFRVSGWAQSSAIPRGGRAFGGALWRVDHRPALAAAWPVGGAGFRSFAGSLLYPSAELEGICARAHSAALSGPGTAVQACMSSDPVSRTEFERLVSEVAALTITVRELVDRSGHSSPQGSAPFELVGDQAVDIPSASAGSALSADRVSAAESIGKWIKARLRGPSAGLSGLMMEEDLEYEGSEPAEGPLLYHNFVCSAEGVTNLDYAVGILTVEQHPSVSCIAVAEVDGLPLCAIPDEAWHRTKKKRKLPEGVFTKMVAVVVPSVADDRTVPEEELSIRLWLGLLAVDYAGLVLYGPMLIPDIGFPVDSTGVQKLPYGESLVAVAKDHFTFMSVSEQQVDDKDEMHLRMKTVEDGLHKLQSTLEKLLEGNGRQPLPKAGPHSSYRKQAAPSVVGKAPPGLDPVVAKHALQAGVSAQALEEVAALADRSLVPLQQPSKKMQEAAELSSDEEDDDLGALEGGSPDPMVLAVTRMSKVLKEMHRDRRARKTSTIDGILDRAESGGAKEGPSFARSKAGALCTSRTIEEQSCVDLRGAGETAARRLGTGWSAPWPECRLSHSTWLGGAQEPNSGLPLQCSSSLVDSCDLGLPSHWSDCRGPSQGRIGPGSGRSAELRPWFMVDSQRVGNGAATAPAGVPGACAARDVGDPAFSLGGPSMVRVDTLQAEGLARVPGAQGQAQWGKAERSSSFAAESRSQKECQGRGKEWDEERQRARAAELTSCSELGNLVAARPLQDGEAVSLRDAVPEVDLPSPQSLHVPGSAAKPVDVLTLWNSLTRWVLGSRTNFSRFLHVYFSTSLAAEARTAFPFWVMPAPYPELWVRQDKAASEDENKLPREELAVRKLLNLVVLALTWLHLGSPCKPPKGFCCQLRCSRAQMKVVQKLYSFASDVKSCGVVGPAEMGRSAAKMEGLDVVLHELIASTEKLASEALAKSYAFSKSSKSTSSRKQGSEKLAKGVVVDNLSLSTPVLAKEIDPTRLSLPKKKPGFDPTKLLDEPHKQVFLDPVATAIPPSQAEEEPPRVRVHTKKSQQMEFLHFLDEHHRLVLAPADRIRTTHLCGAFSLVKDASKDRLILDARGPNLLEVTLRSWCKTLGSATALSQIELLEGCNLVFSGTDLRDYYHCFKVPLVRSYRNALALPLTKKQAMTFSCFHQGLQEHDVVYPCLAALAMGDNNAVELGQKSHIKLGFLARAFSPFELLTVHGRAPRSSVAAGIVIDDVLLLEQVAKENAAPMNELESVVRLNRLCEAYLQHDLEAHPAKTFRGQDRAESWGVLLDGVTGFLRPNPKRLVPLLELTSAVARLGYATMTLLEVLAGSWVAILQLRRRSMCLLEHIYAAQVGRQATDVIQLDAMLVQELWVLVILGPMILVEMRASSIEEIFMTDASTWGIAAVKTRVPLLFSRELTRHCLARGVWAKLLSPWKAWLKDHESLLAEDELPDGIPLVSHPLWLILAEALKYELLFRERASKRKHINLLELEAIFKLEQDLAKSSDCIRFCVGADSQVALAALLKGRSSSPRINAALRKSLAVVIGGSLYGNYGFVPSLANPGDDPTRGVKLREPKRSLPPWLAAAFEGNFSLMDSWLASVGFDPVQVSDLPFADQQLFSAEQFSSEVLQPLTEVQKPERLAKFLRKAEGKEFDEAGQRQEPLGQTKNLEEEPKDEEDDGHASNFVASRRESPTDNLYIEVPLCEAESPLRKAESDFPLREAEPGNHCKAEVSGHEERKETRGQTKEPLGQTKREEKKPTKAEKKRLYRNSVASKAVAPPQSKLEGQPGSGTSPNGLPKVGRRRTRCRHVRENSSAPALPLEALQLLQAMNPKQFLRPGGIRSEEPIDFSKQGYLDLYSGAGGVAKFMAKSYGVWVLTFDFAHGSEQDLLNAGTQRRLLRLIRAGAFFGVGMAPECASFSRAVTPAVRSYDQPWGLPGISANMEKKVEIGNQHADFVLRVTKLCIQLAIPYWIENPDGSFIWLLPGFQSAAVGRAETSYRCDLCRFTTPWRKRTRLATNFSTIVGLRNLCQGGHSHITLRGRSSAHQMSWTRVAQVYPTRFCHFIGKALADEVGLCSLRKLRKPAVSALARCEGARIGEASHPGPRQPVQRVAQDLLDVPLHEPGTLAIQRRVEQAFLNWLHSHLSRETIAELFFCATLASVVLQKYALHLYASGSRLYELRHLLVLLQRKYPSLRPEMGPVWDLVTRWEELHPVRHRDPLPEVLFRAMFSLAYLWGWKRYAALLLLGVEGIARAGEIIAAKRADLLLPSDTFDSSSKFAFLRVKKPKTLRRGVGRVQHLRIQDAGAVAFLERVFGPMDAALSLGACSTSTFRKRWIKLLEALKVPSSVRPTPGGIRGGGAVLAYRRGEAIQNILWRMRISSQRTLESYLQETAAESVLVKLPTESKDRIRSLSSLYFRILCHCPQIFREADADGSGDLDREELRIALRHWA